MVQDRDQVRDQATQAATALAERDAQLATAKDFNGKLSDQLDTCARRSAEKDEVIAALQGRLTELEAGLHEHKTSSAATVARLRAQPIAATNEHQQNGLEAIETAAAALEAARKRYYPDSTSDEAGGSSAKRRRMNVTDGETASHACKPLPCGLASSLSLTATDLAFACMSCCAIIY